MHYTRDTTRLTTGAERWGVGRARVCETIITGYVAMHLPLPSWAGLCPPPQCVPPGALALAAGVSPAC